MAKLTRVASFTEVSDSVLMWGHYSDAHKGFCIEYDFSRGDEIYKKYIFPIIYSNQRYNSTNDLLLEKHNNYINSCLSKDKIWSCEKEWRLIWPVENNRKEEYKFDFSTLISGVYLGVNILNQKDGEEYLLQITSWAKQKNITVYQMHIANQGNKLYSKKI
jgi:hypothetical protein